MISFFIFLLSITKAYALIGFYPSTTPVAPVFNLPANQMQLRPWCPPGACAEYLTRRALLIPQASVQSYSIPMLLLNNSPVIDSPNSYDRIFPDFNRRKSSRERRSSARSSRVYFRHRETGDIQIRESGKIIGQGSLVYVPLEDLEENTISTISPDRKTTPSPTTPPDTSQTTPSPTTPPDTSQTTPDESFLPQPILPQNSSITESLEERISSILPNEDTIVFNSNQSLRVTETSLPEELKEECLVGGLLREKLRGGKCPTRGNNCSGEKDGFRCGPIFNSVCIARRPINTLSNRCYQASKGQALSRDNYKQLLQNDPVLKYCEAKPQETNCQKYPQLSQISTETTEAGFCENCNNNGSDTQEALTNISDSLLSLPFGELLSDTLYSRAKCDNRNGSCSRHDRCIPGEYDSNCRRSDGSCRQSKNRSASIGKCAGYLNKGLNLVLRDYLKKYCENKSMDQCRENREPDICNANFIMPSALCALNLDGKDRINGNTITNSRVRSYCNRESKNYPTHITIKGEKIPLFKEIAMPQNPKDLPVGAIVVSKSRTSLGRKHGHIEVKTNKQCDNSSCFCSDFCVSRDSDDYNSNGTYPYSVAFQLNPEVVKALKSL